MESSTFPSELLAHSLHGRPEQATAEIAKLSSLLEGLDDVSAGGVNAADEVQMAQARLGVASSLFLALKAKHFPTASHGLRVALGCSVWTKSRNEAEEFCSTLEVAALLHDVGKIGVPDEILAKPHELTAEERQVMSTHRRNGLEILANCCYSTEVLETVAYGSAWFDGIRGGFKAKGSQIPLSARMLSIVDAFDSMTTDQVYRRAMSVERAIAELFQCAGTQFDPELVGSFCGSVAVHWSSLKQSAGERWLAQMDHSGTNSFWTSSNDRQVAVSSSTNDSSSNDLFHKTLVENITDGVVYVGPRQRLIVWNRSMERMTGISSSGVMDKQWLPSLVDMKYEGARESVLDVDCPVAHVFQTGQQLAKRVSIRSRGNKFFTADLMIIPVIGSDGSVLGATMTVHDVSSKLSLEERVESLYTRVTQDPLTKVANRAEFDRVHTEFVDKHLRDGLPCSLIISDLDFFKKINDDYGHQAGDHALVAFAALLKRFQHIGDLVARYGGEEFVLLCADCDNSTATARAEEIRQILQSTPHAVLDNKCLTSSFGVTEIQSGDTPETMLRRADRALLMAKERGRNQVVQLGSGLSQNEAGEQDQPRRSFFSRFKTASGQHLTEKTLVTFVPIEMAIEKLRGFVSDQYAQIVSVENNVIQLRADGHNPKTMRRKSDRPVPFMISMHLTKVEAATQPDSERRGATKTKIEIIIDPIRARDRRRSDLAERAQQIMSSLKSYLMATDETAHELPMLMPAATESGRDH